MRDARRGRPSNAGDRPPSARVGESDLGPCPLPLRCLGLREAPLGPARPAGFPLRHPGARILSLPHPVPLLRRGALAPRRPVGFEPSSVGSRTDIEIGDQRLVREIGRMSPKIQKITPQRFRIVSLTRGNVAPIFANRTSPAETGLVGWAERTRTQKCHRAVTSLLAALREVEAQGREIKRLDRRGRERSPGSRFLFPCTTRRLGRRSPWDGWFLSERCPDR